MVRHGVRTTSPKARVLDRIEILTDWAKGDVEGVARPDQIDDSVLKAIGICLDNIIIDIQVFPVPGEKNEKG